MKTSHSLVLAALASIAFAAAPAVAGSTATCPNCSKHTEVSPYPVKVVNPTDLPRTFTRSTVNLALKLDEQGVPTQVRTVGYVDKAVAARVISAVSQWRFSPKLVDGVAVPGEFVLPLEVTPVETA